MVVSGLILSNRWYFKHDLIYYCFDSRLSQPHIHIPTSSSGVSYQWRHWRGGGGGWYETGRRFKIYRSTVRNSYCALLSFGTCGFHADIVTVQRLPLLRNFSLWQKEWQRDVNRVTTFHSLGCETCTYLLTRLKIVKLMKTDVLTTKIKKLV